MNYKKLLVIFLILVAVHSFLVGVGLMLMPPDWLAFFNFTIVEKFFSAQGGIFHVVMVVAYLLAAKNLDTEKGLVYFSISAKTIAFFFLTGYYLIMNQILVVLLSGIGDLLMAVILWWLYKKYQEQKKVVSQ